MTVDQGGSRARRWSDYHQDVTVAGGFGHAEIGADLHVFADGVPVYLLANWQGADEAEPSWLREMPSRMLNARFALVDFTGRQEEVAQLRHWEESGPRLAVRWLHAPGGTGKSRLAARLAAESVAAGWKVVVAVRGPGTVLPALPSQDLRPDGATGLLLIVDYADQWPLTHLATLLSNSLFAQSQVRTRVLLLARTGDAWERVRAQLDIGPSAASSQFLEPLPADLAQRTEMFAAARDSFGRCYGTADLGGLESPVPLEHPDLGLTLSVHVAALVAVDAHVRDSRAPADPTSLTAYLLDREHDHWQRLRGDDTHELDPAERVFTTTPDVMSRVVFAAALTGPVPRTVGIDALSGLDDAPDPEPTLADHAVCYPPAPRADDTVLEPLYPDRLTEDYLALAIPGHDADFPAKRWAVGTGGALLVRSPHGDAALWTPRTITFLAAAAERWPHVGPCYLYPLLKVDPRLALDAGGAALTALARLADAPITLFEAIEPHLPAEPDPDLDVGVAAVARRLTEHRLSGTSDLAQRAGLYDQLATRLSRAGARAAALDAATEAVRLYRSLALEDPARFEVDLAFAVGKLRTHVAEMGRREDALELAVESNARWKSLADAYPGEYDTGLAISHEHLGVALAQAGRHREARAALEEAVVIQRGIAEREPATHGRLLASALINLGGHCAASGQWAAAAATTREGLDVYRSLAAQTPAVFEQEVAHALDSLSGQLASLGERGPALAMARESVEIYRHLAKASPDAFEPDLGSSLGQLAGHLSDLARVDESVLVAEEALEINRRLAAANPAAFDPKLGLALHNLALYQSALGWRDAALATAEQATQVWRRLAQGDPVGYEGQLAHALSGLAADLSELGRDAEALIAAEEGLAIQRRLADETPEVYGPALARTLTNLGGYLARLGRPEDGLVAAGEAVGIFRTLAANYPDAYERGYALALNKLGLRHVALGQHEQAVTAFQHSVDVYRRLAATNPAMFEPELVHTLRNLSPELDRLRRHTAAADTEQEAVILLRRLAASGEADWSRELAGALSDLGASRLHQGHAREAVDLARDAVAIFTRLATADPDSVRDGLMRARAVLAFARARTALSRKPWQFR